ncbi:MAG: heparan-alpha-glucosaminide N-acetyltransferase domain-containing protein, partial [Ornithinimicrobium sp.]
MTTTDPLHTTPVVPTKSRRLIGLDAARAVALIGMMAVHALWSYDAQDQVTWHYSLAAGRSAAAFAVLAGVGIALMTRRRRVSKVERRGVAAMLGARALVIGAIGLILGYTDTSAATVILVFYAALFVLAIPLTFLPTRVLAVLAPTIAIVVPVLSHLLRPYLPASAGGHPSFHDLFQHPAAVVLDLLVTGLYPALGWVAYICAGLVIGRLDLASRRVATGLFSGGLALAVSASTLSWLLLGPLGG